MGKPKLRGGGITQLATLYAKVHRAALAQGFLEHLPLDAAVWEEMAPCNKDFHGEKKKNMTISMALSAWPGCLQDLTVPATVQEKLTARTNGKDFPTTANCMAEEFCMLLPKKMSIFITHYNFNEWPKV